jgi:hypothetical protein
MLFLNFSKTSIETYPYSSYLLSGGYTLSVLAFIQLSRKFKEKEKEKIRKH